MLNITFNVKYLIKNNKYNMIMKNINEPRSFNDVTSGRHLNLNNLMFNAFSINDNVIEPIDKTKVTSTKHKIKNG